MDIWEIELPLYVCLNTRTKHKTSSNITYVKLMRCYVNDDDLLTHRHHDNSAKEIRRLYR